MFLIALIFLAVFTALYALLSGAIIYHLQQYIVAGHPFPKIITTSFVFLAGLFWLFALYFLFKLPR